MDVIAAETVSDLTETTDANEENHESTSRSFKRVSTVDELYVERLGVDAITALSDEQWVAVATNSSLDVDALHDDWCEDIMQRAWYRRPFVVRRCR